MLTGYAKRDLNMEGYELKLNNQYTLVGIYSINIQPFDRTRDSFQSFESGFADILLMEGSDAIQSIAATTTALIAFFAF